MKKALILLSILVFVVYFGLSCSTQQKTYSLKDGVKLFKYQKYEEAIEVFEKVFKENPSNINAQYNLAVSYIQIEKYKKAIELLENYIKLKNYDQEARYNLAFSYLKRGCQHFCVNLKHLQYSPSVFPQKISKAVDRFLTIPEFLMSTFWRHFEPQETVIL